MRHAVILVCDSGERLHPLTGAGTPAALLALGDRKTLVERSFGRLAACIPVENLWVLALPEYRAKVEETLGTTVHVAAGSVASLAELLTMIASPTDGSASVLLQPATHVVTDEEGYRTRILSGLDGAAAGGHGVSFTSGGDAQRATGIQAWPAELLRARVESAGRAGVASIRDLLSMLGPELAAVPLGDVGWLDVDGWEGIQKLLAYVEKPWGYERLWALNRHYAGKILFIRAGESLSLQYHEVKDETICVVSGRIRLLAGPSAEDLEAVILKPRMRFAIPPRLVHQMEALEDSTVLEGSTPHLTDVVRLEDRYGRS